MGWLFSEDRASVLYYPPERLDWPAQAAVRGGAGSCPAIGDLSRFFYVIRSPFTLSLRCTHLVPGREFRYNVVPIEGEKIIGLNGLQKALMVLPPDVWENPQWPTLQLHLPYVFVSDESVFLEQVPAFACPLSAQRPVMLYAGRFPIDIWPRHLNYSFQWLDPGRDILVRRGDPLFYLRFYPRDRERPVRLIESQRTRELDSFIAAIRDVTESASQTYALFPRAAEMRPPRLVVPKESYRPGPERRLRDHEEREDASHSGDSAD